MSHTLGLLFVAGLGLFFAVDVLAAWSDHAEHQAWIDRHSDDHSSEGAMRTAAAVPWRRARGPRCRPVPTWSDDNGIVRSKCRGHHGHDDSGLVARRRSASAY